MRHLTDWIKNHQVVAFFIITFAITWGLGFSYNALLDRGQYLLAPLAFLATCGPALSGIIISAITHTQPRQGARKSFWIAFFVAWIFSVLVFLAHNTWINHAPFSLILLGWIIVMVLPVPFVIASAFSRKPTVRNYLSSLIHLRGVWGWAILALGLMPALILLAIPVNHILGWQSISSSPFPDIDLTLIGLLVVKFTYQLFFFNATGEEPGWRGFAMPRLQAHTSPLIAAIIIGFFWTLWHVFLWHAEGRPVLTLRFWGEMGSAHMLMSLIIVWICNRARGNILVAGFAHAMANTAQAFLPVQDSRGLLLTWLIFALVLVLVDRMWKKLPPDHPAVFKAEITA